MLEMVPGFHTQNIVEEIFRLQEAKTKSANPDDSQSFDWLQKYTNGKYLIFVYNLWLRFLIKKCFDNLADNLPAKMEQLDFDQQPALSTSKSLTSLGETSLESDMSRSDLTSGGVAPIAARESVLKHQMSLKEDQVSQKKSFSGLTTFSGVTLEAANEIL